MKLSLIIPIYNEEKTLNTLLNELEKLNAKLEILIINDGSTDSTESILRNQKNIKVIHNKINRGKGFSIINASKYINAENIILMDGDLEIDLDSISDLINTFEILDNQVMVGCRWNDRSNPGKHINTYGNYFINYLFNFLYGTDLNDVLCCVKVINKKLFNSLNLKSHGFNIEMEIMSKLAKKNIKFLEKNVVYNRRKSNEGKKIKLSDSWGILKEMVINRFK